MTKTGTRTVALPGIRAWCCVSRLPGAVNRRQGRRTEWYSRPRQPAPTRDVSDASAGVSLFMLKHVASGDASASDLSVDRTCSTSGRTSCRPNGRPSRRTSRRNFQSCPRCTLVSRKLGRPPRPPTAPASATRSADRRRVAGRHVVRWLHQPGRRRLRREDRVQRQRYSGGADDEQTPPQRQFVKPALPAPTPDPASPALSLPYRPALPAARPLGRAPRQSQHEKHSTMSNVCWRTTWAI